jgi:hypothetical protein
VIIRGSTKAGAQVFINDQNIPVDLEGGFNNQVGLSVGLNEITVKSVNKFNKESVEVILIHADYGQITAEEYQKNKKDEVILTIKVQEKPTWLKVIADDIVVYEDVLDIDEEQEFLAKEKIVISAEDGKNILISNDGEDFEELSNKNESVKDRAFIKQEELKDAGNNENSQIIEE